MWLLQYHNFRNVTDGMLLIIMAYCVSNYYKRQDSVYMIYFCGLCLLIIDFRLIDYEYTIGRNNVFYTWSSFVENIDSLFYAAFSMKLLHISDKTHTIKNLYWYFIYSTIFWTIVQLFFRFNPGNDFFFWSLFIEVIINMSILFVIFFKAFELKYGFIKYFIIGSFCMLAGYLPKAILQFFPKILTNDISNAFTFSHTYAALGFIVESIFMFMGLSAKYRMIAEEKKQIHLNILKHLEEKNNQYQKILYTQSELMNTFEKTLTTTLANILELNQKATKTNNYASQKIQSTLKEMQKMSSTLSTDLRHLIVELNNLQKRDESNQIFKEHIRQISAKQLDNKGIKFNIYINKEYYFLVNYNEKIILGLYQDTLQYISKYKNTTFLNINISVSVETYLLSIIIQDQGGAFFSKEKMLRKFIGIEKQLKAVGGDFQFFFEFPQNELTIRMDFPMIFDIYPFIKPLYV